MKYRDLVRHHVLSISDPKFILYTMYIPCNIVLPLFYDDDPCALVHNPPKNTVVFEYTSVDIVQVLIKAACVFGHSVHLSITCICKYK